MNLIEFMRKQKKNDGCDETVEFYSTEPSTVELNRVVGFGKVDTTIIEISSYVEIPANFDDCWNLAKSEKNYFMSKEGKDGYEITV